MDKWIFKTALPDFWPLGDSLLVNNCLFKHLADSAQHVSGHLTNVCQVFQTTILLASIDS